MMKKLLTILLAFVFTTNLSFAAYSPTNKEIELLSQIKPKIINLYDKDINKAYSVKNDIDKFFVKYKENEAGTYFLNFVNDITIEYIKSYEDKVKIEKEKQEQEKQKQEEKAKAEAEASKLPDFDNVIKTQNEKLNVLTKDTKTIAYFDIEPKYDHFYLKNIYFENIGTINDISNLFQELYLVDEENRIITTGYVNGNFLFFDVIKDYILQQDKVKDLYVKAIIRQPTNKNQIGELKFQIKTPQNSPIGTLNGVRATSYSNGSFVTISPISNPNPITTLVTYNDIKIVKDENFEPTYNQAIGFRVYNNSSKKLEISSFVLQIAGSFLSSLDENTRFMLKVKGANSIFGTAYLKNMNTTTGLLSVNYGGSAYNYISANSYIDYILEIEYSGGTPSGSREIRLNNVIVGDGFGGTITNLNQYSDVGVPTDVFYYKY